MKLPPVLLFRVYPPKGKVSKNLRLFVCASIRPLIAFCRKKNIDLLLLTPYCSHFLQPLDVGVHGQLKRYHAFEADRYTRAGVKRFERIKWLKIFQRIKPKDLSTSNIISDWIRASLVPSSPTKSALFASVSPCQLTSTLQRKIFNQDLDLSVLKSSIPDVTELRQENKVFKSIPAGSDCLASPTRRYAKLMTKLMESRNVEINLLRKGLKEYQELNETIKMKTNSKRIQPQGQFTSSSEEVLEIMREAEQKPKGKKPQGRSRKRILNELDPNIGD